MTADPPSPIVTITDPSRPGSVGDVLSAGEEREPWRPTRTQVRRTGAVLGVLALLGVPLAVLLHVRHDHALDRAAVRAVKLGPLDASTPGAVTFGPSDDGTVPLYLANLGPQRVVILSARIDREGYPEQRTNITLEQHGLGFVDLTLPDPCPAQVSANSRPRRVVLTVRTVRGQVVQRVAPVDEAFGFTYQDELRRACGVLTPAEATENDQAVIGTRNGSFDLQVRLTNQSRADYRLEHVGAVGGLAAQVTAGALPLAMPARGGTATVTARISIESCEAARLSGYTNPLSDLVLPVLLLTVSGDVVEIYSGEQAVSAISGLIERTC